jgi:hypothetical protein
MEALNIDTIGPVSRDSAENCCILVVVIDCCAWFVELYPVSDTTALPCARALLDHVRRNYGTPMAICSDRGSQFVNGVIRQLLILLQVEHCVLQALAGPYSWPVGHLDPVSAA